ncbi:hypothetical protein E4U26_003999 [Claviceps purpurea]|nr:hypothetical protein E4U26_003999 [Claviceps purpurea]
MKVLSLNVVPFFPRGLPKDQVNDPENSVAPNKLDGERIDSVHSNLVPLDEIRLSNAAMGGTMDVPTGFGQFTEAKMSRGAQVLWETTTQLFPESQHVMYPRLPGLSGLEISSSQKISRARLRQSKKPRRID